MASRAILRKRRFVSDYLNVSARSIQCFSSLGHGLSSQHVDSHGLSSAANHSCGDSDCMKKGDTILPKNEDLLNFSALGLFRRKCYGDMVSNYVTGGSQFVSSTGMRFMPQSIRYVSTATAGQRDVGSDNEDNEGMAAKKRKEASPEECDQAVEGLSSAKAKAKAKRLQESEKVANSVLQRVWATFLGIGPALRAVASMSRFKKISILHLFVLYRANMFHIYAQLITFHVLGKIGQRS